MQWSLRSLGCPAGAAPVLALLWPPPAKCPVCCLPRGSGQLGWFSSAVATITDPKPVGRWHVSQCVANESVHILATDRQGEAISKQSQETKVDVP